jgi:hypothetical protein
MAFFRSAILILLVTAGILFAFYAGTGQARFRRYGLFVLSATLIAAFVFFGVLILQRL